MGALYVLSNISGLKAPHVRGRMVMLAVLLLWVGAIHPDQAQCQAYPISNGTVNTCIGAFLDSGGEGGAGYGNNENFTYTICPDNANDAVSLTFLTFQLNNTGPAPADQMTIHDGNSTVAPTLGTYAGNALEGYVVNASPLNTSGCLTIVFRSNAAGTGIFAASITCYTPCQRPTAVATMSEAAPAKVCPGEAITFNSTGSFAAPGFTIANRRWEWGDGTVTDPAPAVTTHTYAQPGYYQAQLYLVDDNGCASTNRVDLEVFVGTAPTFNGTGGDILGCVGETLCLDAVVNPVTFNEVPTGDLGNGVFLPDQVGSCFTAEIEFTQFDPGQTLTSVADLLSICMNMEHSFIGDLVVRIISPTGQTVTMHQQGGGATFLGIPVDNDAQPNAQGTCWQYCFSPTATNGTWVDNMGVTLPSGTYESLNPLNGLVGSQLNGIWQLQICDLWASDNGFVCDWNITFDPDLFPDLVEFTPVYGTDCDSSSWSGPGITSTTGDCQGICMTPSAPGVFPYTYTVTDDFGCGYDTTLSITVIPPATISAGADVSTCNTPVPLNATITTGGFPSNCVYQLILNDSFGDGWTLGSSVTVTVNGVPTTHTLLLGSTTTINIPVTNGATVILNYTAALLWNGEQSYTLLNSTGGTVYASPLGPISGNPWSGPAVCPAGGFVYSWSPATGLSNPNIANPIATVTSTTTYCVTAYQTGHPACPATDCVTITVDNAVDPGTDGSVAVCADGAPISLFGQLGGTPNTGGTWIAPNAAAHSGTFIPGADPAGVYTYTVTGTGACGSSSATSTVTVAVASVADAGTNSALTVCSMDGPLDLFATLGGAPQTGGVWTGPSAVVGGQFDPATMSAGAYTYTVTGTAPCPNASAIVTVTINMPPNAGVDGTITLCSSDAPAALFGQLGGTPDPGGTWSGPSAVNAGMIDPATMSAGVYTYTVTGTAPCPDATATVTVTINTPPDPGTDGAITLCTSDAAVDLFAQLGGTPDAGGVWTGPSAVVGGQFDPATMSAGAYTYTVTGTAPCPNASAIVTVTINMPPNAGVDGTITLCSSDAPAALFGQLGGTPDPSGTWSGPSAVNAGMIDPATMSAGVYTYTVTGTAPCPDATATVTVTINMPPDPGTDGAITLCTSDAAVDLFAQLGGTPDAGGVWTGPSAVVGGQFDPATMGAGAYTYTVTGTAPCPNASAIVTVTINMPPNAGVDGTITLCSSDAPAALFGQLGGTPDPGGTWSGPSAVNAGMIDPATMSAGVYTYTVTGTAPCPDATATVTVTINMPPDPGTDGAITLCTSDAAVDLFAQLGGTPDAGGVWTGPSAVVGGQFDPATMSAGAYTYTVTGTAPCPNASAIVTVTINTPPNAGVDGTITLCSSDAPAALFGQLGGTPDPGGTWSGPSAVNAGMIDPATMSAGVYTYTVTGTAPCPDATATVTVTINMPPDPGTDGAITLCTSDAAVDLFAQLGGTPDAGGVWTGPSAVVGGQFDPATMSAGAYTYTVTGTAPCPNASAIVTVTINTPPNAGVDGTITLCSSDAPAALFGQLGGTPDPGGTWSGPSAVNAGMIDPATMSAGVYTYTVTGTAPCPDATATVTVTINMPPDPGTDGAIALCVTSPTSSLFNALGGNPDQGGTWSGPSVLNGDLFDPATMTPGVFTYTLTGTVPCPSASSEVTVNVVSNPDPGTPSAITLCTSDGVVDLFGLLGGTPDPGGSWSGPSTLSNGQFDPATMVSGSYTYTIAVPPPCVSVSSTVSVTLDQAPDAGTNGSLLLCISSPSTPLLPALGGSPDAGGTWSGPSPMNGGLFDPATMSAGTYTYTVAGTTPCPASSADVLVAVATTPDAGTPGGITVCASDATLDLFNQLGGTPDPGGSWTGPSTVVAGLFDPATMNAGVYTYTIDVPPPCVDVSSTVTVVVVQPPTAGSDGSMTLCISSPSTPLLPALGGSPDAGGTWSGPSPMNGGLFDPATMSAGTYTYTVAGTTPCPASSADVLVAVATTPDAGTPGGITVCASDATLDLFNQLGGTPDPGGSWTGPSTVVAGLFDPATMNAGVYTYTIDVPPPCVDVSSTVTVVVVQPPTAGSDGSMTLCISSPSTPLLPALGGSPDAGGTWSGPSPVNGGLFDPATMSAGAYTYTVAGTTPCPASSADVLVAVATTPDAGTPGSITVCASDATLDLFNQLGGTPDPGGSWTGPSTVVAGLFDPATMNAGVYTYTIDVPPPCVDVSSTVTVVVVQPPTAGSDGSMTHCISSPSTPLLPALGGSPDAGGTWSGPSPVNGGLFDPATMSAGIYTYAVSGIAPCPAAFATVEVNVVNEPDPGGPGFLTACATGDVVDLFTRIEGTPDAGGVWSGPSALTDGSFNPAIHTAGEYTYTLNVPPPCTSASTTVTVDVVQPPDAGADASVTVCASGTVMDLYGILGGDPDPGGSWTIDGSVPASASFDPTADLPGTFQYTVFGEIPCPNDVASVTVNITEEPFAGNDAILNLCISGDPVNVFNSLSGAETGGTWIAPGGGPFNGTFVPGTSLPGEYIYQVLGMAPCPSDSARVSITQLTDPNAGGDASITLCSTGLPLDLFSQLQGNPDPGGIWSNSNQVVIGAAYDPSTQPTDDLYYVLAVPPPCVSDTAHLEVTIIQASDAGEDTTTTICTASGDLDLFATLGGVPDPGGNWIGPQGATDGIFSPVQDPSGAYTYTILATTPCPTVMATVTVAVEAPPNAGVDGGATLCPDAAPINLFSLLGGTPASTGSWTDPGGSLTSGTFDPAMDQPGLYTYTVFGTLCPNDVATASVAIWFVPSPYVGEDEVTCTLDHELMAIGDWAYGAWTGPPGSTVASPASSTTPVSVTTGGAFTFHWNSVTEEGCTNVDSVTIIFTRPLEGIATTTDAICHDACDGTAHVLATGGNGDLSYTWSVPSIGDTATATGLCAGQYTVNVADTNACALSLPMLIGEPAPLTIDGISTTPETCPGSCDGILVVADPDGVSYILSGNSQTDPTFNSLCPGIHTVMMIDANGCTAEMEGLITSPPPVIPSFTYSPDTILANGTEVHFANLSSPNAVTFNWVFGDGDTSPIEQPVHSYPQGLGGVYEVCLVATDLNGCSDTVCAPLIIHDLLAVHVPNAFTPNGDGVNDVFLPVLNVPRVKDYQFMVFNRWGELIFGTERPGEPWDGAYQGVVSQVDVYVWRLTCKDALSGDLIEKVGHVSIVR